MALSLGACSSGETEPSPTPEAVTSTIEAAADYGRLAVCASLNTLRDKLGYTTALPVRIFADEAGIYGETSFVTDRVREAIQDVEVTITTGDNTFRGDSLGADALSAIATSELAVEAAEEIHKAFDGIPDDRLIEASNTIDQSDAVALTVQARDIADTAITSNC